MSLRLATAAFSLVFLTLTLRFYATHVLQRSSVKITPAVKSTKAARNSRYFETEYFSEVDKLNETREAELEEMRRRMEDMESPYTEVNNSAKSK